MMMTSLLATCAAVEVIKSTYQSFLPGESCESIYNNNAESHEWSGYYWITISRVYYCHYNGINYTSEKGSIVNLGTITLLTASYIKGKLTYPNAFHKVYNKMLHI